MEEIAYLEKINEASGEIPYVSPCSLNIKSFPHYHSEVEIVRCDKGSVGIVFEKESKSLKCGEIAVFMPYEIHDVITERDSAAVVIKMRPITKSSEFDIENIVLDKHFLKSGDCGYETVNSLISRIKTEKSNETAGFEIALAAYSNEALLEILRNIPSKHISKEEARFRHKNIAAFKRVTEYIKANFKTNISLADVAKYCGYSKFYFSRMFKEMTGMLFVDYLAAYRTKEAVRLMENTDFSQLDIAVEVGFNSYQRYVFSFKKIYGETPQKYKNRVINNETHNEK